MSTAKMLSQTAAHSGVSGISVSRGNSDTRSSSRNSLRSTDELVVINSGSTQPKSSASKSKLSPLEQSPESDSPESERRIERKLELVNKLSGEQLILSLSSVKSVNDETKLKTAPPKIFEQSLPEKEMKIDHGSSPVPPKLVCETLQAKKQVDLKLPEPEQRKKSHDRTNHRKTVQVETSTITLKTKSELLSSATEIKPKMKHKSTNFFSEPTPIPQHKTSSSSDMSRKSNDQISSTKSKVCKPGSGCRGRAAAAVLPIAPPAIEHLMGYPPTLYRKPSASAGAYMQSEPYHMSRYIKTLPRSVERVCVNNITFAQPHAASHILANYNTIPRPSRFATHIAQSGSLSRPLNPPEKLVGERSRKSSSTAMTVTKPNKGTLQNKQDCHIILKDTHKPVDCHKVAINMEDPTIKSKSLTHPNFPADIRSFTESTML